MCEIKKICAADILPGDFVFYIAGTDITSLLTGLIIATKHDTNLPITSHDGHELYMCEIVCLNKREVATKFIVSSVMFDVVQMDRG